MSSVAKTRFLSEHNPLRSVFLKGGMDFVQDSGIILRLHGKRKGGLRLFPVDLAQGPGGMGAHQRLNIVEECGFERGDFVDESLLEVFAEARGMVGAEGDVFVEVEHGDFGPVDVRFGDECGYGVELAGAGGEDDVGGILAGDCVSDGFGGVGCGGGAHLCFCFVYVRLHCGGLA